MKAFILFFTFSIGIVCLLQAQYVDPNQSYLNQIKSNPQPTSQPSSGSTVTPIPSSPSSGTSGNTTTNIPTDTPTTTTPISSGPSSPPPPVPTSPPASTVPTAPPPSAVPTADPTPTVTAPPKQAPNTLGDPQINAVKQQALQQALNSLGNTGFDGW